MGETQESNNLLVATQPWLSANENEKKHALRWKRAAATKQKRNKEANALWWTRLRRGDDPYTHVHFSSRPSVVLMSTSVSEPRKSHPSWNGQVLSPEFESRRVFCTKNNCLTTVSARWATCHHLLAEQPRHAPSTPRGIPTCDRVSYQLFGTKAQDR